MALYSRKAVIPHPQKMGHKVLYNGVFQIAVRDWGKLEMLLGGIFLIGWRKPEEEWFWRLEPLSKLKIAFCEYWASIEMKINMTCVSKEYEIKTKIEQE